MIFLFKKFKLIIFLFILKNIFCAEVLINNNGEIISQDKYFLKIYPEFKEEIDKKKKEFIKNYNDFLKGTTSEIAFNKALCKIRKTNKIQNIASDLEILLEILSKDPDHHLKKSVNELTDKLVNKILFGEELPNDTAMRELFFKRGLNGLTDFKTDHLVKNMDKNLDKLIQTMDHKLDVHLKKLVKDLDDVINNKMQITIKKSVRNLYIGLFLTSIATTLVCSLIYFIIKNYMNKDDHKNHEKLDDKFLIKGID